MNKKFQAFISSTFKDLREERTVVVNTLLTHDCIPTGMEFFTAMNEEQLNYIKDIINLCDYYVLIIAGKYGTVSEIDGVSFTEKEYDYAIELQNKKHEIDVLAFIYEYPEKLPVEKFEINEEARLKLDKFRKKVSHNRLVKFWNTQDELAKVVGESIAASKAARPKPGWVKDFPLKTEFPDFYNRIIQNISDLKKEIVASNACNSKYKLLIYDWILQNKYEQTIKSPDESIKINILQPGEKSRKLFGSIITSLNANDSFHTMSTLSFWTTDLENNEKGYIEDNIDAINNGVQIERVILIDEIVFDDVENNKSKLLALDKIVNDLLLLIHDDEKIYDQIKTRFLTVNTALLKQTEEIPYVTIFSNIDIKDSSFDLESAGINTCIMQITSKRANKSNPQIVDGLNVSFFNDRTRRKILRLEARFLEAINSPHAMDVYELNKKLSDIQKIIPYKSKESKSKDEYILSKEEYSIVECKFSLGIFSQLNNAILLLRNKEDGYYTLIDTYDAIKDLIENASIEIKDDPFSHKKRHLDHWKMIKIERTDAINLTGVVYEIAAGFKALDIPICIFTIFDGVYLFIRAQHYKQRQANEYLSSNYIFKYFDGGTPS